MDTTVIGIGLGSHKSEVLRAIKEEPEDIVRYTERIEVWSWPKEPSRGCLTPFHIHWVDDKVSEISGCQLSYRGKDFGPTAQPSEIKEGLQFLDFRKGITGSASGEEDSLRFNIVANGILNHYCLTFVPLAREWAKEMLTVQLKPPG